MKTLKTRKPTIQPVTLISNADLLQVPAPVQSLKVLGGIAVKLGLPEFPKRFGPGFVLNARYPIAPGKASLHVPVNKYEVTQDDKEPYYYSFNQLPFFHQMSDAIWGEVRIKFERGFLVQDGIINLRVGGFLDNKMSSGYSVFDGVKMTYIPPIHGQGDINKFRNQNISLYLQKSLNKSVYLDIIVTCRLSFWKFFDASYTPFKMNK